MSLSRQRYATRFECGFAGFKDSTTDKSPETIILVDKTNRSGKDRTTLVLGKIAFHITRGWPKIAFHITRSWPGCVWAAECRIML